MQEYFFAMKIKQKAEVSLRIPITKKPYSNNEKK